MAALEMAIAEADIERAKKHQGEEGDVNDDVGGDVNDDVGADDPAAGDPPPPPPQPGDRRKRIGLDQLPWGCFVIARKSANIFEARCPFHKKNEKTDCKKTLSFDPSKGQTEAEAQNALHWGCNQAKSYEYQRDHLMPGKRLEHFPQLPYSVLLQDQITQKPDPKDVVSDVQLDSLRCERARGGRGGSSSRGRGHANSSKGQGRGAAVKAAAKVKGRGRGQRRDQAPEADAAEPDESSSSPSDGSPSSPSDGSSA